MKTLLKKFITSGLAIGLLVTAASLVPQRASAQFSFDNFGDITSLGDLGDLLTDLGDTGDFNFDDFSSIFSDLGDINDLGDMGNLLGDLDGVLGDLGDFTGIDSIGDLGDFINLGEISGLGDLGDLIGDVGDIGSIGDIGDILESVGALGEGGFLGDFGDILGDFSIGDFGDIGDISSIADVGNILGDADGILGNAGTLGSVGEIVGAGDLGDLSTIGNLGGIFGGGTSGNFGAVDQKSLEDMRKQYRKKCEKEQEQDGGFLNDLFEGFGLGDGEEGFSFNNLLDDFGLGGASSILEGFGIEDGFDGLLSNFTDGTLTDFLGGMFSGGDLGGLGGINSVPVSDATTHQILGNIDKQTKQSNENEDRDYEEQLKHKNLLSESCFRLHMILGELTALNNYFRKLQPDSFKNRARGINKAAGENFSLVNAGHVLPKSATDVEGTNTTPLYTTNLRRRVLDEIRNAFLVVIDDLEEIENEAPLAAQSARDILEENQQRQNLADRVGPSETWQERGDAFLRGESDDPLRDNIDFWDPTAGNNQFTAYLLTRREVDQKTEVTEQNIREELIANEGWLGIKICVDFSKNGHCRREEIITDAATMRAMQQAYLKAYLDLAINDPSFNADYLVKQIQAINKKLGESGFIDEEEIENPMEDGDPCPGTEPCPDTGWENEEATPDREGFPGSDVTTNSQGPSSWQADFGNTLTDNLDDFLNDLIDDFFQGGEDALNDLIDFQDITNLFEGDRAPSQWDVNHTIPDFADQFVANNQDLLRDDLGPDAVENLRNAIINFIITLLQSVTN
ncbi:MAG: hypothetical protein U9M92_01530 [Patescibacteria group bacterium]|nr:hypothetical protein [Patescibacteria group bacterium]